MSTVLDRLLKEGTRYNPNYLPSMNSDHLPMSLSAMTALGAPDDVLIEYQAQYAERLHEAPTSAFNPPAVTDTWQGHHDRERFAWLQMLLLKRFEQSTVEHTVAEVLATTLDGIAAEAFHPLIRLGYALEANHSPEIAAALAYMVSSYSPMPLDITPLDDLGFTSLTSSLQRQSTTPAAPYQRFGVGLRELTSNERYPLGSARNLNECAHASLSVYRSTRNFFALHMVTATYAARVCSNYLDEVNQRRLLAALTGALLAAHQIVGSPAFDADRPVDVTEPDTEHLFKYLYVIKQEHALGHDPRYQDELSAFLEAGFTPTWLNIH